MVGTLSVSSEAESASRCGDVPGIHPIIVRTGSSCMFSNMHRLLDRRDALALAALSAIGVGVPLWLSWTTGAIGLPSLDDWVYIRGADSLFLTGLIDMPGHTAASVGQIVMVQPFLWLSGGSSWAYTAFGLVMTFVGLVATYLLARRFVGLGSAVMVVLLVEAFPGFAREAASFMTDVPAYSMTLVCVLLGVRWLDDGRRLDLAASLGAGVLAVSIREFAIAAPAAVLIISWFQCRPPERRWLSGMAGLALAGLAADLVIASSIPGRFAPRPDLGRVLLVGPVFVALSAVLLPAIALGLPRRLSTLLQTHVIVGATIVSIALIIPWGSHAGNSWTQTGVGGDLLLSGTRADVFGAGAWTLSAQVASLAAILAAALVVRWTQTYDNRVRSTTRWSHLGTLARNRSGLPALFLLATSAELVVFAPFFIYDRYLFVMVPVAAILLLINGSGPSVIGKRHAFSHAAFVWLAVSAFIIAANSFAYDSARWRLGQAAVAMGYEAQTVDAGYAWIGSHARGAVRQDLPAPNMTWNIDRWSLLNPCAVLSNSPLSDSTLRLIRVDRSAYLQYLFFGPEEPLYLYGAVVDGCPPVPATIEPFATP